MLVLYILTGLIILVAAAGVALEFIEEEERIKSNV